MASIDLLRLYPFIDTKRMHQIELEQLGIINRPVRGMDSACERMLQRPPEGVIRGESISRENEQAEITESYQKAKEQRIKSLERQERLKKEVE